jgi:hypothetical protein
MKINFATAKKLIESADVIKNIDDSTVFTRIAPRCIMFRWEDRNTLYNVSAYDLDNASVEKQGNILTFSVFDGDGHDVGFAVSLFKLSPLK